MTNPILTLTLPVTLTLS